MISREDISEINPEALLCDGFDDAIMCVIERINLGPVVAYDSEKIIKILMKDMKVSKKDIDDDERERGMTIKDKKREMALEYFEYNIKGSWMGEFTPVFSVLI